ncbi:GSCFA domain-containing protein [Flavobacterium ardleyense]|uniref:GSCFA domain-containing protein n=1 Tax=Flavobacterium ardleyense TaxID=2038737 RepID=A0ABW5ZEY4_9FLAO
MKSKLIDLQFTTKIPLGKFENPITYESKILALGSCFSENIAEKFEYFKFQTATNPFGIIFNPVSIENLVKRAVNKIDFTESDIFFHNELWHCYEVHSELSHSDKDVLLNTLNDLVNTTHNQILSLTHCFITLGTSWIYRNVVSEQIVANCHKVPQKEFIKELLSIATIEESLANIINILYAINPNCSVIFTVSPVRHIKDGFVENTLSKAHLITALQSILKTEHYKLNTEYFPSFEIMMDELRDYRFYADDLLHPSKMAVDYIWERFAEAMISKESLVTMEEIATIQKGLAHRPFNLNTESHMRFVANVNEKIAKIRSQFPFISF